MQNQKSVISDLVSQQGTAKQIFLTTEEQVRDFNQQAYSLGYTQMRIPAGTSFKGDYSFQTSLFKYHEGKVYVALLPYDPTFYKNNPTAQSTVKPPVETPFETGKREVEEETKLLAIDIIEIFRDQDNGKPEVRELDKDKVGKVDYDKHLVHRGICTRFEGTLPYFPDFKNPDDAEIGQPVWVNMEHVLIHVYRGVRKETLLYYWHIPTVRSAAKYFMHHMSEEYGMPLWQAGITNFIMHNEKVN